MSRTTDSLFEVHIVPASGQSMWRFDERTIQAPRLELGFCIQGEIETLVYDYTNRL